MQERGWRSEGRGTTLFASVGAVFASVEPRDGVTQPEGSDALEFRVGEV